MVMRERIFEPTIRYMKYYAIKSYEARQGKERKKGKEGMWN